jgi:hypothetical protein
MIEHSVVKKVCSVIFNYSHGMNIDLMCGFEGHEWFIFIFLNECYYVYDPFGHGKVIAQPQALKFY